MGQPEGNSPTYITAPMNSQSDLVVTSEVASTLLRYATDGWVCHGGHRCRGAGIRF